VTPGAEAGIGPSVGGPSGADLDRPVVVLDGRLLRTRAEILARLVLLPVRDRWRQVRRDIPWHGDDTHVRLSATGSGRRRDGWLWHLGLRCLVEEAHELRHLVGRLRRQLRHAQHRREDERAGEDGVKRRREDDRSLATGSHRGERGLEHGGLLLLEETRDPRAKFPYLWRA
jgi:hypothetical protein